MGLVMKRFLALEASAGSGKTFYLSIRYISLLFLGARIDEIVCLTFTNKATDEMKERIKNIIDNLQVNSVEFKEIKKQSGLSEKYIIDHLDIVRNDFNSSIKRIFTIDSMIGKLLRHYAQDIGINTNFNIGLVHPDNEISLFLSEIKNMKEVIHLEYIIQELTLQNKELYELLFYLYEHDFEIECIKDKYEDINVDEYKSIINYLVDEKMLTNNEMKLKYFRLKEAVIIKSLLIIYEIFKKNILKTKKDTNILNFNDVTHLMYEFIKDKTKNIDHFRCNHLLIDEFQDTSIVQYKILEPFIDEILNSEDGTFFYVGDIKQSIYRFRGSNYKLFHFLKNDKSLDIDFLEYNYRSDANIVNFVNMTSKNIFNNYKDQKTIKSFQQDSVKNIDFNDNVVDCIVKEINQLLNENIELEDIAILCRSNHDIDKIAKELIEYYPISIEKSLPIIDYTDVERFLENEENLNDIEKYKLDIQIKDILIKEYNKFNNFKDFKYHIENLKINIYTDGNKENNGIKLLTIHKSKGLEFNNVFLIDNLKKLNKIDDKIFFHYDSAISTSLYVDFVSRTNFDQEYKQIKIDKLNEDKIDDNNILYVGMTRAKNKLFLLKNIGLEDGGFI